MMILIGDVNRIRYLQRAGMKTEKNCATCEFNAGVVCMGYGKRIDNNEDTYGMPIEDAEQMFPNGCSDWGISLFAFIEECESYNK